ncbi:hypothetical protein F5888DRAFT_820424 [Russula emetica]|nr:hypothetical protein F5888DRAFT_820424 [Russula emetica]
MKIPCSLTIILSFPLLVNAYTWQFTSQPRQCQTVSLSIQGSGGQPPYSLLIIPTGPSPLPNNTEVRSILNIPFSGTSTTLSFNLNYPENSSFVAVVSDKSGFGTGGASTSVTVLQSFDSSCYSSSKPIHVPWVFYFEPTGGLTQCESVRLWWEAPSVNGCVSSPIFPNSVRPKNFHPSRHAPPCRTVNFYGTIPGGTSFTIPQGSLSTNNDTGTGFNWTVDIVGETDILLVGNDDGGIGSGGSVEYTIANTVNNSCLNNNSPSFTAGNPAGGGYSTSTSEHGSGSHSSSNTGAMTGGGVGAAILLGLTALAAFWFFRRRPYSAVSQQRPVNVLQDDEDGNEEDHDLPQYYAPEPYLVPDPTTIRGMSEAASTHDRPLSMSTVTADVQRPQTPMTTTTTTRKSAAIPQLRPANIIQYDDAGPSEDLSGQVEPETIELPPAYSSQPQSSPLASSTPTAAEGES